MAKMIQLVIAMAALLVCAYSLPVRTPEEQADKELRDLKSGLSATNQVLKSFTKKFRLENINKTKLFLGIVQSITKLAELQATVNEIVEATGEDASDRMNVTKFFVDRMVDDACTWMKSQPTIRNQNFTCSLSELEELNMVLQVQSIMASVSKKLRDFKGTDRIDPCQWMICNSACNPDIDTNVVDYINRQLIQCDMTEKCQVPCSEF